MQKSVSAVADTSTAFYSNEICILLFKKDIRFFKNTKIKI